MSCSSNRGSTGFAYCNHPIMILGLLPLSGLQYPPLGVMIIGNVGNTSFVKKVLDRLFDGQSSKYKYLLLALISKSTPPKYDETLGAHTPAVLTNISPKKVRPDNVETLFACPLKNSTPFTPSLVTTTAPSLLAASMAEV